MMNQNEQIPRFEERFPELDQLITRLSGEFKAGKISSWEELEIEVRDFFTPDRMNEMESALPGWHKMASYLEGITLVHVICVFLGLYMLPEFINLSPQQQGILKWAVLLHDIEKEIEKGKRDPVHAFHSAVSSAQRLPLIGFSTTNEYRKWIDSWSETTFSAIIKLEHSLEPIQDNHRLREILSGIEKMFGNGSPASQIIKIVLLHMSVNVVSEWPQSAPLSEEEITQFVDPELMPLLKVMMLADNEGWGLFSPNTRLRERNETLETFQRLERKVA